MQDVFYHGVWRMDWGLGNPNKTAALIAMLMIAVLGFAYIKRWGFWLALVLFTGLGICLIHTFSRGGILALAAGLGIILWKSPRPWLRSRIAAVVVAFWVMIGATLYLNAHQRFAQGVVKEDRSITNRLAVWKESPRMMVDAPDGWGYGKSGYAYGQWYQPLENYETYRTLVNSHLTWFVEFGWVFRYAYLFAWFVIFLICWPSKSLQWLVIPLGLWIAFAVAATFSTVAESSWLWILPSIGLITAFLGRSLGRNWPTIKSWSFVFLTPLVCVAAIYALGYSRQSLSIHYSNNRVIIGDKKEPDIWALLDAKMVGNYGRELRKYVETQHSNPSIGIIQSVNQLPEKLSGELLIGSQLSPSDLPTIARLSSQISKITLLNPKFFPQEIQPPLDPAKVKVVFGDFSQSPALSSWQEKYQVQKIEGMGDFTPHWPELLFTSTSKP